MPGCLRCDRETLLVTGSAEARVMVEVDADGGIISVHVGEVTGMVAADARCQRCGAPVPGSAGRRLMLGHDRVAWLPVS